jgi:predicted transposase YbfD/YdcC
MLCALKLKLQKKIIENNADYILAVKGNQKELEEDVKLTCCRKQKLKKNRS